MNEWKVALYTYGIPSIVILQNDEHSMERPTKYCNNKFYNLEISFYRTPLIALNKFHQHVHFVHRTICKSFLILCSNSDIFWGNLVLRFFAINSAIKGFIGEVHVC